MLNILIQEADQFFRSGLQRFFMDFFLRNFKQPIHFATQFSHENVSTADIIVLSLCKGETLTCIPELQARQKGIVIGLVEDAPGVSAFNACFQDILFIPRNVSLDSLSEMLFLAWYRTQAPGYIWKKISCCECQYKILSPQQIRIMVNFYRGLSVVQVARALEMNDKTVFTHKYMMMQKFNLRTDFELIALIRKMVEKKSYPNLLRDYLVNHYGECVPVMQ
ncbi:LuxR C-terminal-related transcriptional regulator [Enterobacter sichuanensis]|uniref:helix-turn-helix transcriptional regulator n=1 Tax=Enterobacter sichuanensis TaxID=2071710 RepID=UPI0021D15BB6|nr:LuxR C-terminal-related transcriptional regulator [Enterobacter sichuanensis]MCU6425998.1 LuxR C-terminal-related transcriptional regulator [Enterobacter sichuanensis]